MRKNARTLYSTNPDFDAFIKDAATMGQTSNCQNIQGKKRFTSKDYMSLPLDFIGKYSFSQLTFG